MSLRGTNQELGRPFNRRIVLELIRRHGQLARNEIASCTGLTVQTISNIVRELEDDGYLISARLKPKGRGLPPQASVLTQMVAMPLAFKSHRSALKWL